MAKAHAKGMIALSSKSLFSKNSKLCFYVKSEYQISKKTMDEVDKRLQYISRVLEKQYGGVTIENEDTLK